MCKKRAKSYVLKSLKWQHVERNKFIISYQNWQLFELCLQTSQTDIYRYMYINFLEIALKENCYCGQFKEEHVFNLAPWNKFCPERVNAFLTLSRIYVQYQTKSTNVYKTETSINFLPTHQLKAIINWSLVYWIYELHVQHKHCSVDKNIHTNISLIHEMNYTLVAIRRIFVTVY